MLDTLFVQKVGEDLARYGITYSYYADDILNILRKLTYRLMSSTAIEMEEVAYIYYALSENDLCSYYKCVGEDIGHHQNYKDENGDEYALGLRLVLDSIYRNKGYIGETTEDENFHAQVLSALLVDKAFVNTGIINNMSEGATVLVDFIETALDIYYNIGGELQTFDSELKGQQNTDSQSDGQKVNSNVVEDIEGQGNGDGQTADN